VNSRRLYHINYKALPYICKVVTGLPELKGDHEGVCDGCAQGKNVKKPFSKRDNKEEGVLELIHSYVCAQCHHPPIMGMYTMYHSLMIILLKDLDIFEIFNEIKEFKALIRETFCKED
jgi:hypothetical protein